jgi:ankyrin repeat protein
LQLIERILHAFTGQRYLTQRYLSGQIGRLITKLDDHSVHLFSKLLVSANEPILKGLSAWEDFFRRSSKAFDELFVKDVPRHDPYSAANFTAEQNAAFDAIYRGDCPALNMIIHRNPKWYLDPKQNLTGVFYAQCYVAAIHGDQEHILEFLIQKGFLYSQLSGEENLLMLASRLGRSKIVKSLSQRPFLKLDVNYSAADGMRALHLACSRNHSETLKSLISNFPSIDIHVQNVLGESAVSLCVKYGHLSAIETLIESVGVVAFLSILNASKQNIFHLAASAENPAMLHSVLSTILKAKKQTHVLGDRQPSCDLLKLLVEINKRVTQPEMSQILIAALLAPDINGDTPAHICIHSRSIASLAMLIHVFPIAVLIPNASGSSPIHIAASRSFYSLD